MCEAARRFRRRASESVRPLEFDAQRVAIRVRRAAKQSGLEVGDDQEERL